jgi:hypothetical protein
MSIYRGFRPLLTDVQVSHVVDRRSPETAPKESPPFHLRKAQPVNVLLPRTRIWMTLLPEAVRPNALGAQFPRIVNHLCAVWGDPFAGARYFAELLTDDRGGRKGFSTTVLREIEALKNLHARLHRPSPRASDWDDSIRSLWDGSGRK